MTLAERVNSWLSPATRKRIYALVAAAGAVAIIWGLSESLVASWTALVLAVAGVGSAILASIMARRVDYTLLYVAAGAVVAALVTLRYLDPDTAQRVTQTLAVIVTVMGGVATMRTDPGTIDGAPTAEAMLDAIPMHAYPADGPSTTVDHGVTTYDPGDGTPTTSTWS